MTPPRIAIIGAGSITFSMTLIRDVIAKEELAGSVILLVDIDEARLRTVTALAQRLVRELNAGVTFEAHLDRGRALDGVEFVINTAAANERPMWLPSREIARRHGYMQAKTFTLATLRNTPVALGVARDMERWCPKAWLIQYANPMVANIGAVSRATSIRAIGLCHGMEGSLRRLSRWMGLDRRSVQAEAIGINHFIWLTRFWHGGEDAYPALGRFLGEGFPSVWDTQEWENGLDIEGPVTLDLYRRYGLVPLNGDCHLTDYYRWYSSDEEHAKRYRVKMHYGDRYIAGGDRALASLMELAADDSARVSDRFRGRSSEAAVDIIDCLHNGRQGVFEVNIPNRGCLAGFPSGSCVEIPALVSGNSVQGLEVGPLPPAIHARVLHRLHQEELLMRAVLEKRTEFIRQFLLEDPYTTTTEQAEAFLDEFLPLVRDYVADYM